MLTELILIGLLIVLSAILYVSCAKNDFESLDLGNLNKPQQEHSYRIPVASHLSFSYKTGNKEEKKSMAVPLSHYGKNHPNDNLLTPPFGALASHREIEAKISSFSGNEEKKVLAPTPAITNRPPDLINFPIQIVK